MITVIFAPVLNTNGVTTRQAEHRACSILAQRVAGPQAVIEHYPDGAPFIPGFPMHISVTHCRSLAAMALSHISEIGIDAEVWRPQLHRVVHKYLAPSELSKWATTPRLLLLAWTIKEAVYKAARTPGLPLHSITLPDPELSPLVASTPDGRQWLIHSTTHQEATVTTACIHTF